jgi:predicted alpha/beta hydrolase
VIKKVLTFVVTSLVITLCIALGLIASQRPIEMKGGGGLDFTKTLAGERAPAMALTAIKGRDGFDLQVRDYPSAAPDAPLVVLIHGSGWHGLQFDGLARQLSETAHVIVPDLRGHGPKPGRRGDVDYIGQLEDDLADLIAAYRTDGQQVVMGGHSSGGGLVVLKHDAPTTRTDAGGWTHVMLRRIIGLSMLNTVRITALNHLEIIQLNMPKVVLEGALGDTATTAYSYRLNASFAPRARYLDDVAALPKFVLIAGADDEAFDAALYEPTMTPATDKGSYVTVADTGHLDIVDAPQTAQTIESFLNDL